MQIVKNDITSISEEEINEILSDLDDGDKEVD